MPHPDHTLLHKVENCASCKACLGDTRPLSLIKRQVFDIPEPQIKITYHQAEVKVCDCGHINRASFPMGINVPVQYGPRVKALAVYFSVQQLIPEDRLQAVFWDLFSLPLATATLTSINTLLQ